MNGRPRTRLGSSRYLLTRLPRRRLTSCICYELSTLGTDDWRISLKIKAVTATDPGGIEVLQMRDVELPWPRSDLDVLVRLEAAGVNPADCYFRKYGGYLRSEHPLVLGHDGAGVVEATGTAVTLFKPGDRVCFCNGGIGGDMGTYAAAAVVPEPQLARIPDGVDTVSAAALPLACITAWEGLLQRARIEPGESVLVHAGAGGTGHIAVQLASLRGCRVATTISSREKASLVRELGAELAVDYRAGDFVDVVRNWRPGGVEVAFDNVGGDVTVRTYGAMAPYGRLVTLMGFAGDDATLTAYNANLSVHAVMMLTPMWLKLQDRLAGQADIVRSALRLLAESKLRVHVAGTCPLSDVAEAHRICEAGRTTGKIVILM